MTGEKAKDLLDNLVGMIEDNHNNDYDVAIKMGIKAIEQTTWHLVYDELPKKFGTYIVTAYDGHMYRTSFAKYQSKLKSWILTGQMSHWRIVAWQPLPEPYRVESEE